MTAFSAWARLLGRLPEPAARTLVERVLVRGLMMGWPPNRRGARANLRRILAAVGRDASAAAVDAALDRSLGFYARFLLLMAAHPAEVLAARERVDLALLPRLKELGAERKGVVLVTANYGLVGHAIWHLAESGVPVTLPILNREFLAHFPPSLYRQISTVGASAAACLRGLEQEEVVVQIADINFLPRRRTVAFFGAPAPLGYAAARLAAASGAPILPAYATADGDRCRFECDEPVRPQGRTLEELHAAVARSMERFIGRRPEQWLVYEDFWDLGGMDRKYSLARRLARFS